jgi:hypothetical protein
MRRCFGLVVGLAFGGVASAGTLDQQLRLVDALGQPLDGNRDLRVVIVADNNPADADVTCHTQTFTAVPFQDGFADVRLTNVAPSCFGAPQWVAVSTGTPLVEMAPRIPVADVPSALVGQTVPVAGAPGSPTCATSGAIAWDTSRASLRVCNGSTWSYLATAPLGATHEAPGTSCTAILASRPNAPDGIYWVSPTGSSTGAIQVFCEMSNPVGVTAWATFEQASPPIHWWDFSTPGAGGGFADRVGSNRMLGVGTTGTTAGGVIGGAGTTANTSSWFASDLNFDAVLGGAGRKSISVWVKTTDLVGTGGGSPVFGFGSSLNNGSDCTGSSFSVSLSGGNAGFVGCADDLGTAQPVANGQWRNLTATYDGTIVRMYLDGVEIASGAKSLNTRGDYRKFVLGADAWWRTTVHHMNGGQFDEAKVYDYALTRAQVAALVALGNTLSEP